MQLNVLVGQCYKIIILHDKKQKKYMKAKDYNGEPIMIYRGRIWNIEKVEEQFWHKEVSSYWFYIRDQKGNQDIRVCYPNDILKIPNLKPIANKKPCRF